jgi:4,5-DOPA dioxygenase extradiol
MTFSMNPAVPAGAYDEFVVGAAAASRAQRAWTPADGALPALYLSHGAPPLLDDAEWMKELSGWAHDFPKPTGILIISAHWESAPLSLSATAPRTPLVYDFGGFARRYYELTYPTPDAAALARRVAGVIPEREHLHQHRDRGLDHGAWVPLMVMYPLADVPVLQLSLPTQDPGTLLELGSWLRPLREEGVLVIGSGFMTHGLPYITREMVTRNAVPAWSSDFDAWVADALARGDIDTLAKYRSIAPGMPYAHPTPDHYIPLFVTLGAGDDVEAPVRTTIEGYAIGMSKRSFQVS